MIKIQKIYRENYHEVIKIINISNGNIAQIEKDLKQSTIN